MDFVLATLMQIIPISCTHVQRERMAVKLYIMQYLCTDVVYYLLSIYLFCEMV